MLVLTRKINESLIIGDNVKITVTRIDRDRVRIAIEAPKEINIAREEIWQKPEREYRDLIPDVDVIRKGDQIDHGRSVESWGDYNDSAIGRIVLHGVRARRPLPEVPEWWTRSEDGKEITRVGDGVWEKPYGLYFDGRWRITSHMGDLSWKGHNYRLPWPPAQQVEGKEGK